MKRLLPTCFLPLAVTFTLHTGTLVNFEKPNTNSVHSTGINNNVVIDSLQLTESFNKPIGYAAKDEITQTGENNRVEINTGGEEPKNKHQKTINKSQTNSKLQTTKTKKSTNSKPATCNLLKQSVYPDRRNPDISSGKPATFTIKQTCRNNSVKINSR